MKFVTWEELIELSKLYNKVVITGCQRSGTTYTAEALAKCLNYKFCDEKTFRTECISLFENLLSSNEKMVIQAPAILHELKKYEDLCLIVVMHRNKEDVVKSMEKHNWLHRGGKKEWRKFSSEPYKNLESIYDIKIKFSEGLKKVDLMYDELEKTEGFVKQRIGWSIKQTSPNQ